MRKLKISKTRPAMPPPLCPKFKQLFFLCSSCSKRKAFRSLDEHRYALRGPDVTSLPLEFTFGRYIEVQHMAAGREHSAAA